MTTRRTNSTVRLMIAVAVVTLPVASAHAAGVFSSSPITGDGDTSIAVESPFALAIDANDAGNRTVNGAVFTTSGLAVPNPATNNYSTSGFGSGFPGFDSGLTAGGADDLMDNFLYGGAAQTVTLNNLRIGQSYTTTFYQAAFGPTDVGIRVMEITASDGGVINNYDENATPGSELKYTFTATANTMTYTITPQNPANTYHLYAFSNQVNGYEALLTDNYYAPGNPNTLNVNFNLEARQGGRLAAGAQTVTYTSIGNQQVGNPTGGVDSGNYLLSANGRSALDHNFNNGYSAGGLLIAFDMAPNVGSSGDTSVWSAIALGLNEGSKTVFINDPATHFGILFRGNGQLQAFDGNSVVSGGADTWTGLTNVTTQLHRIELLLRDSTDGNPFDGVGQTEIAVYADGLFVFAYTKTGGGYANNFINFSGISIGAFDNLLIAQVVPAPAALPAGLALIGLATLRGRRRRR